MKTKQFLCGVLATLMLAGSCFSASAAQITNSGEAGQTLVTYGMNQGFIVTIPTDFTIDDSGKALVFVEAENVVIPHGTTLQVSVSGNDYTNKWELIDTAENDNRLEYIIGTSAGARDIINNTVVLSVAAGLSYNAIIDSEMHFTVVDELSKAGTYKDTLTFNVGVYTLAEGNGQQYDATAPDALSFRSLEPIETFEDVYLNNELVDRDNYTVTSGSTIVTFKESFLATLPNGNYRVSFKFTSTTTDASFKIVGSSVVPENNGGNNSGNVSSAGLFDADGNFIVSWEDSGIDFTVPGYQTNGATTILNEKYPNAYKVILPENIQSIPSAAFAGTSVKEIVVPDGVSNVGDWAFNMCGIETFSWPRSATTMSYGALAMNVDLKTLYIPDTVTFIDYLVLDSNTQGLTIYYEGSEAEWNAIRKDSAWSGEYGTADYIIVYGR